MIVALLVVTACGGASESSVGTSTSPSGPVPANVEAVEAVEAFADALTSVMGDERTALAAVLLAGDLGYGVDQIAPAGVEGRLQPDGSIVNADGAPLTPDYEPSGILDDDVTGDASEAVGFRLPPRRIRLTAAINNLNRELGSDRGSLITVLLLLEGGYTLEQIVLALLADGLVDNESRLIDENDDVIEPERAVTVRFDIDYGHLITRALLGDAAMEPALTSPTVTAADTTAPGVTEPLDETAGERVFGGSVHQVSGDTPGLDLNSAYCLDYSKRIEGGLRLSLTACTDTPHFEVVHDLEAGTVEGWIDVELACPGLDRCRGEDPVAATVSGTIGPFAYGQQPQAVPADWPFPADHWYSSGLGSWWAGGPIELDVWISGSSSFLNQAVDQSFTVMGWVNSTLSPSSRKPGELPSDWMVDLAVDIDYVDADDPRWDFYVGGHK